VGHWWADGNRITGLKHLSRCQFVDHESHINCTGIELRPPVESYELTFETMSKAWRAVFCEKFVTVPVYRPMNRKYIALGSNPHPPLVESNELMFHAV